MSTQQTLSIDEVRKLAKKPRKAKDLSHGKAKRHELKIPAEAHITREEGVVWAVLPWPPSDNGLLQYTAKMIRGKLRVFDYASPDKKQYTKVIAKLAKGSDCTPLKGELWFDATLYRPRKIGDVYRLKLLLDTLQGVAYDDDKQIRKLTIERRDDKANPRVEIVVRTVEPEGLLGSET
jgi:Holliday junction resolvase RusA-like endonuclease